MHFNYFGGQCFTIIFYFDFSTFVLLIYMLKFIVGPSGSFCYLKIRVFIIIFSVDLFLKGFLFLIFYREVDNILNAKLLRVETLIQRTLSYNISFVICLVYLI